MTGVQTCALPIYQKGIKTIRKGEVGDQITGDLLKGAGARGWNREERRSGCMYVDLVLLARSTALDITVDIGGEAWPPELGSNKLASLENTRMTCCGMVMVASHNGVAQFSISRDIDMTLVSQDACIIVPVREAGTKSGGDSARQSMEGVKNQWVRSGGRAEFVSEGGVNKVDEELIRKEDDCLIVCVRGRYVIWMTGQGVGGT